MKLFEAFRWNAGELAAAPALWLQALLLLRCVCDHPAFDPGGAHVQPPPDLPAAQAPPASPMQLVAAIGLQECAPAAVRVPALEWMAAMAVAERPDGGAVVTAPEATLSCLRAVLAAAAAGSARVRAAAGGAAAAIAEVACRSSAGRAGCAQVGRHGRCPEPCLPCVPGHGVVNLISLPA